MSRPMKATEIDAFEKKFGYKPSAVGVAIDALAVFVHKDNPAKGLTLKQIDSAFSSTFKLGGKPAKNWGDLGLSGAWSNRAISLYGRNSASGTYGVFKDIALSKGDYASNVKEQPGSSAVVQGIGSDLGGLGYSGYGYKTSSVRVLPVNGYPPSADNVREYPPSCTFTTTTNQEQTRCDNSGIPQVHLESTWAGSCRKRRLLSTKRWCG